MSRASSIASQAIERGITLPLIEDQNEKEKEISSSYFLVTPGSEQIRSTLERDGQLDVFRSIGGKVLANACGPCIGQWNRKYPTKNKNPTDSNSTSDTRNSIISSFNRNFAGRNDGNTSTHAFVASPEVIHSSIHSFI